MMRNMLTQVSAALEMSHLHVGDHSPGETILTDMTSDMPNDKMHLHSPNSYYSQPEVLNSKHDSFYCLRNTV